RRRRVARGRLSHRRAGRRRPSRSVRRVPLLPPRERVDVRGVQDEQPRSGRLRGVRTRARRERAPRHVRRARARERRGRVRRGAAQAVITGGGAAVLPWAAATIRDGGLVHYFAGGGGDALPLALDTLYKRELTLSATYSSSPADLAAAFALISAGAVNTDALVTHRLPLDRLDE